MYRDFGVNPVNLTKPFVWVRMEYCDVAHRAHWTQAGVMHRYGEPRDVFWTLSQSISPSDSGEPDYERCPR